MAHRFSRRNMLAAAGLGALALPLGRGLLRSAHADSGTPKRLIVFWTPNGAPQNAFWPSGSGSSFTLSNVLKSLEPHKSSLAILKGITYSGTGDHKTGKPFSVTGFHTEDQNAGTSSGPSIDQEVGAAVGSTPLVVCGQSKGNVRGYISYDKNNNKVNPVKDPKTVYETVFGALPTNPSPMPEPTDPMEPSLPGRDDELHNLILETSMDDVKEVRNRLPGAEQVKMDDQLAALTALKKDLMTGGGGGGGTGGGGVMPAASCMDVRGQLDAAVAAGAANYRERIRLHTDIIATAFACDLRRVASIMVGPVGHDNMGGDLGFISGVGGDVHNNIAHPDPSGQKMIDVTTHHAEQFAYLISKLKSVQEGSGTLFDNTVVLWATECTHGNHGHTNIPAVIATGSSALKTNQFLQFDKNPGWTNVLLAVMHAVGHPISSFGASSTGPLDALMG